MAKTSVGFDAATRGTPSRFPNDQDVVMAGGGLGQVVCGGEIHALKIEVDELQAHLLGHAPHQVGLGDESS